MLGVDDCAVGTDASKPSVPGGGEAEMDRAGETLERQDLPQLVRGALVLLSGAIVLVMLQMAGMMWMSDGLVVMLASFTNGRY